MSAAESTQVATDPRVPMLLEDVACLQQRVEELERVVARLDDRTIGQMHFGGSAPTFVDAAGKRVEVRYATGDPPQVEPILCAGAATAGNPG